MIFPTSRKLITATLALAVTAGCAGVQKKDTATIGGEVTADEVGRSPADVLEQPRKPDRNITAGQKADFDKALDVYHKLKKHGPLKGSGCDEAADAFRRAADQNPALLEARHNEAAVLLECDNRSKAMQIWEEMARAPKPYAPALTNLGLAAYERGDLREAETLFGRAIQADTLLPSIWARINLAQILRDKARRARSLDEKKGYNDQAIRNLRTALALDGNNLQAYATLCYIYFDLGLPEAAKLIGGQALKRAEEVATGKLEDATAESTVDRSQPADKKKPKKGKDAADEPKKGKQLALVGTGWTADMKKQIALVHNTLGLVALSKRAYSDAISSFKRAVDLDPALYESRLNLAAISLKFRDYPTAEENFRAVLNAQPKNYEASIGLGVAMRGNRKFDEAEKQYVSAQKLDPSRPESYFNLGLLYQEYKAGADKPMLQKAQAFYRNFLGRSNGTSISPKLRKDAEKRIKDIDELFVALEEAAKLQKEAEEMQRKAEAQQKKMEEEMKKMEELEKKQQAAAGAAPAAGAPGTTPPPVDGKAVKSATVSSPSP